MSQNKKAVGRPSAAIQRAWSGGVGCFSQVPDYRNNRAGAVKFYSSIFLDHCGLKTTSSRLMWRVPYQTILDGIQTVGGIAKLAGVTRKTIYRRKIISGSTGALLFVIGKWQADGRAIVKHKTTDHPINLNPQLPHILSFCSQIAKHGWETDSTWHDDRCEIPRKKWKRKEKHHLSVKPSLMTDEQREWVTRRKKLGQTFFYEPQGKVTVAQICTRFKIPRREFYRWKKGLLFSQRKLLDAAIAGKTLPRISPRDAGFGGGVTTTGERFEDFNYDEIDARLKTKS